MVLVFLARTFMYMFRYKDPGIWSSDMCYGMRICVDRCSIVFSWASINYAYIFIYFDCSKVKLTPRRLRIDLLLYSMCDTVQLLPKFFFDEWVMAKCLKCCTSQWAAEGVCEILRSMFKTGLRLMKQFARSWNLPCCQCTETYPHVSSIQNNIYICI